MKKLREAGGVSAAPGTADEDICVETVLKLVSHGNAVIAELLRLKDNVPKPLLLETKEDRLRYADVVFDFSYFKNSDSLEKKISSNPNLQESDDELKENHSSAIARFYLAFESIYRYVVDLNRFFERLTEGNFLQRTLETFLRDDEGKQLLCESVYLYGVMLLICETFLGGELRERLLVAQYRSAVSHHQTNIDKVCELLRDTGFKNGVSKRPSRYPDELFSRMPVDERLLDIVIGTLRSEDIYNQINIYPLPEHRSVALSDQAAMLVVCLFFTPNTLTNETGKMREVVDKYFPDNWIVSVYMGITVNLIDAWEPYRAAKLALANTVNSKNIKDLSLKYAEKVKTLTPKMAELRDEGALKPERLMEIINKILNLLKDCNSTLRWTLLHTNDSVIVFNSTKKSKQIKDQIISESRIRPMDIFQLLINTSLVELSVKEMLKDLVQNKKAKWENQKLAVIERVVELSEIFSGDKPLPRVSKNENLHKWFGTMFKQIDLLDYEDSHLWTKKIVRLIQALEDVQEFHQLDNIMQVKQLLLESRTDLKDMLRGGGLSEDVLISLQVYSDLSYGWFVARTFTDLSQEALKNDPTLVSDLRAVFLKLSSALEIPLMRINQASSRDLLSVSEYYSRELVSYVKEVLQIIPSTVFKLLEKIIDLQTSQIKELPTRLDKDRLKDYAQLKNRMEMAKLTHSVSIFTSGVLKMRSTLVGIICIDPKQLLEDGIRLEVSKLVEGRLLSLLCKNNGSADLQFLPRIQQLSSHMDGYRRSFEYIQDYINIHGLKIWQEEVSGIFKRNLEEETNKTQKLKTTQSIFHSFNTIFSALIGDLYNLADPKNTVYIEHNTSWYDAKTHQETLTMSVISELQKAITPGGMHGTYKSLSQRIATRLQHIIELMSICNHILPRQQFQSPKTPIPNPGKFYPQSISKLYKHNQQLIEWIQEIGTSQLLCKHLIYQLNTSSKFDSYNLESSLRLMNTALVNDVKNNFKRSEEEYPHKEYIYKINKLLERVGILDPYETIFIKTNNDYAANILFFISISIMSKLQYFDNLGCLTGRKSSDQVDGIPFIVGVSTILKQHHPDALNQYVLLLCQYVISFSHASLELKTPEFTSEASTAIKFLEAFSHLNKATQALMEDVIPSSILFQHQFMASKTV